MKLTYQRKSAYTVVIEVYFFKKMFEEELDEYTSDRELIAFICSNPLLWQKRIKIDKRCKDNINLAFSQIGSLLSKPLTGDAVSTRWKSLRDQFSRELRKVIVSQPRSGAGSEQANCYKPTWPLFNDLLFLKDVIKPRKTQSNISRKKLKVCDSHVGDSHFNIVIPPSNRHTPQNTELVMSIDSTQSIIQESQKFDEESQIVEESQMDKENQIGEENQIEDSQIIEENFYSNSQFEDPYTNEASAEVFCDNDVRSVFLSNLSTSGSHSSTVPPPDKFYTKKKAAIEQMHGVIKSTATKINSVCDNISANFTRTANYNLQPECTASIEDDSALVLIKSFLKKVPPNMKARCLSDIMTVLDKYFTNVSE